MENDCNGTGASDPLVRSADRRGAALADTYAAFDAPAGFVEFALLGCPLVAAGRLFFLYSLVSHATP